LKYDCQVVGTRGYLNGGPDKSRLNEMKQFPRLFKGFNVFIEGHFGKPYPSSQDVAKVFQFSFVIQTETFSIEKKRIEILKPSWKIITQFKSEVFF
jgi:hypothetical protein